MMDSDDLIVIWEGVGLRLSKTSDNLLLCLQREDLDGEIHEINLHKAEVQELIKLMRREVKKLDNWISPADAREIYKDYVERTSDL